MVRHQPQPKINVKHFQRKLNYSKKLNQSIQANKLRCVAPEIKGPTLKVPTKELVNLMKNKRSDD